MRSYFDHNATTPVAREVLEHHGRVLSEVFGNASSIHHHGQTAKQELDSARAHVAALAGCARKDVVFTSGGTEADNLAVFGVARGRVVTSAIEHPAVLNACRRLEEQGVPVTYIPVGRAGVVDPDGVRAAVRDGASLVSIMHVNSETGVVQPVADIARVCREAGVAFHSDGVQALGRIPVDLAALGIDLYSASAHKMYAPKGTGALIVRNGIELDALFAGGRQERALRPGTENVAGAAAMGAAAKLAASRLAAEGARLAALRDRLERSILERIPDCAVNGSGDRAPNTTNIRFDGIEGEAMVISLDLRGFSVSSGSACSSGAVAPSHVLLAMGLSKPEARSSIRFSLGASNTADQVDDLANAVAASAEHLRKLSPAYV